MRPDAGAVQKRHPTLDPTLLGQTQQPLPDTQARPADEGLSRPRPRPKLSRNGAPLGPVLMPPDMTMAEIERRRSWGGVLPLGRHASISGSRLIHSASTSIAPPHLGEAK